MLRYMLASVGILSMLLLYSGVLLVGGSQQQQDTKSDNNGWGNEIDTNVATWINCSLKSDNGIINDISFFPDPLNRVKQLTAIINLTIKEKVIGGVVYNILKYNNLPYERYTMDLCKTLKEAQPELSCPLEGGNYTLEWRGTSLDNLPSGDFEWNLIARDQTGAKLLCFVATLKLT